MRPSWTETWLTVADAIAQRGRCTGRKIGAVIVSPTNRPISMGYAGPPAGMSAEGDCSVWCPRRLDPPEVADDYSTCFSIHAEANALLFADRSTFLNGTIYVTAPPCFGCAKLIANSGIACVVFRYTDQDRHLDHSPATGVLRQSGLYVSEVI